MGYVLTVDCGKQSMNIEFVGANHPKFRFVEFQPELQLLDGVHFYSSDFDVVVDHAHELLETWASLYRIPAMKKTEKRKLHAEKNGAQGLHVI